MKIKTIILLTIFIMLFLGSCSDKKTTEPNTATVVINLTTSDGGSVIGATSVLQNHVGGSYERIVTSSSVIFTDIPFGTYSVIVSHANYHTVIQESFSVQSHTVSHSVNLSTSDDRIGNIIQFGDHEWRILDIQGDRALVVSENILERRGYHTSSTDITYADCSLRAYLNGEFYNSSAFSNADRERIVQVINVNENNQWFGTNSGANTQDRIFLLSIAEVVKYFGDSGQLAYRPSGAWSIDDQYNTNRIATFFDGSATFWWLRSPGSRTTYASLVRITGELNVSGIIVNNNFHGGVRPALWLNL
ncbi:MAG: DUF6273 domain-containing protein [Candidatus Cloacimonetes bacterium]|nr:DUF6273 domain-containing protein [Candidatus Cloacimonadota bacterium]